MSKTPLDLSAIEASLRAVQRDFARINASLDTQRDPLRDVVIENLLAGYEYVGSLLAADIDPLARGNSRHLLQLNLLVLCGTSDLAYEDCAPHIRETERRFYDDTNPGGVRALMNYLADHKDDRVCQRAAGVFIQMLSAPQLFIEGNHRTGALVMSYLLCREGRPPFVLSVGNAKAFFDPASLVKGCRKRSFTALLEIPKLRKRFAAFIEKEADRRSTERRRGDRRVSDRRTAERKPATDKVLSANPSSPERSRHS